MKEIVTSKTIRIIRIDKHNKRRKYAFNILLPSRLGLKNTPTASLQRGKTPPPNECPGYDTKQSDGEVPAVLELCGMWSTPSLTLLPSPLWPGVVAPDRTLSMG